MYIVKFSDRYISFVGRTDHWYCGAAPPPAGAVSVTSVPARRDKRETLNKNAQTEPASSLIF